jgi:hypothetical protein
VKVTICDLGFGPSTGLFCPTRAENESGIGRISCLLAEASQDLPGRNSKDVIPEVVPADFHQPDEAELPAARNRECASKQGAIELIVVLLAGDLLPALPINRSLDEQRSQMATARTVNTRADCVVCWHNQEMSFQKSNMSRKAESSPRIWTGTNVASNNSPSRICSAHSFLRQVLLKYRARNQREMHIR